MPADGRVLVRSGSDANGQVDQEDVEFVVRSLWRMRSALNPTESATVKGGLRLSRWRPERPLSVFNMVLVSSAELKALRPDRPPEEVLPPEVVERVDMELARAAALGRWRA